MSLTVGLVLTPQWSGGGRCYPCGGDSSCGGAVIAIAMFGVTDLAAVFCMMDRMRLVHASYFPRVTSSTLDLGRETAATTGDYNHLARAAILDSPDTMMTPLSTPVVTSGGGMRYRIPP